MGESGKMGRKRWRGSSRYVGEGGEDGRAGKRKDGGSGGIEERLCICSFHGLQRCV